MRHQDVLTDTQVRDLIRESRSAGIVSHYANSVESGFELPHQVGQGYWKQVMLREGFRLGILNVIKRQTHLHLFRPDSDATVISSFYLAGRSQLSIRSLGEQIYQPNRSYVSYLPDAIGTEEFPAAERVWIIQLEIDMNLFRSFYADQIQGLPTAFSAIAPSQPLLFDFGRMNTAIQTTLQQILNCPYEGFIKRLYLESKALELLALQFQQAADQAPSEGLSISLSPTDVERIHLAREILSDRIDHPPGLTDLARIVGLNDFKLKQGFKQLYRTTVFGYLNECRMQRAQFLLQERRMNVEEVAHAVGYANRSSFAVAFRRRFGINPKRFLS